MAQKIGELNERVIDLLGLSLPAGMVILVGEQNIDHMKQQHPDDYAKYGDRLQAILESPDYVSRHPIDGSIQYIKDFGDRVLVGVRLTGKGALFARTLFVMSSDKWDNYMNKGYIKKY